MQIPPNCFDCYPQQNCCLLPYNNCNPHSFPLPPSSPALIPIRVEPLTLRHVVTLVMIYFPTSPPFRKLINFKSANFLCFFVKPTLFHHFNSSILHNSFCFPFFLFFNPISTLFFLTFTYTVVSFYLHYW